MPIPSIARSSALFTLLTAGALSAQTMGPPRYMQIFREEVKMGRGGAHVLTESAWPRAFARAKIPNSYVALTTLFGPNEAWFVEGHASVAELEAANKAIETTPGLSAELDRLSQADAANVASSRAILVRNVPELSNGPDINPAQMRIWEITIFRVRPGKEGNFFQGANLYKSLVQQARVEAPWATYEVMAGMPGPTYLVFSPHKTLAEIDPATGVPWPRSTPTVCGFTRLSNDRRPGGLSPAIPARCCPIPSAGHCISSKASPSIRS